MKNWTPRAQRFTPEFRANRREADTANRTAIRARWNEKMDFLRGIHAEIREAQATNN